MYMYMVLHVPFGGRGLLPSCQTARRRAAGLSGPPWTGGRAEPAVRNSCKRYDWSTDSSRCVGPATGQRRSVPESDWNRNRTWAVEAERKLALRVRLAVYMRNKPSKVKNKQRQTENTK